MMRGSQEVLGRFSGGSREVLGARVAEIRFSPCFSGDFGNTTAKSIRRDGLVVKVSDSHPKVGGLFLGFESRRRTFSFF